MTTPAERAAAPAKGMAGILKKLPMPVWLLLGGTALGLGYAVVRDRGAPKVQNVTAGEVPADAETLPAEQFYSEPAPAIGSGAVDAVGGVSSAALDTFAATFGQFMQTGGGAVVPWTEAVVAGLPASQPPPPAGGVPAPVPATARPPQRRRSVVDWLKASGARGPAAGYQWGSTVYGKSFPSALGWARIGSGGRGAAHWIDVHVMFCNRKERWRYLPNVRPKRWDKVWSGGHADMCARIHPY